MSDTFVLANAWDLRPSRSADSSGHARELRPRGDPALVVARLATLGRTSRRLHRIATRRHAARKRRAVLLGAGPARSSPRRPSASLPPPARGDLGAESAA